MVLEAAARAPPLALQRRGADARDEPGLHGRGELRADLRRAAKARQVRKGLLRLSSWKSSLFNFFQDPSIIGKGKDMQPYKY